MTMQRHGLHTEMADDDVADTDVVVVVVDVEGSCRYCCFVLCCDVLFFFYTRSFHLRTAERTLVWVVRQPSTRTKIITKTKASPLY